MTFRAFIKEHVEMIVSVVAVIMAGGEDALASLKADIGNSSAGAGILMKG